MTRHPIIVAATACAASALAGGVTGLRVAVVARRRRALRRAPITKPFPSPPASHVRIIRGGAA